VDGSYNQLLSSITTTSGEPIHIESAFINGEGLVTAPVSKTVEFRFTGEELQKIINSAFVRIKLNLRTNGSAPVVFRTTDYIRIRAYATINVTADLANL